MKVIDIVKTVATFLARENVLAYLEKGEGETSDENYGDALNQIDYMVRCSNLVINELAGSFVPMIKREKVVVNDGKIYYGTLNENATEIISVSNESERQVNYKMETEYMSVAESPVIVEYKYIPYNYDLNDEVGFDEKVSARTLAYGVCAEICLIERNFSESLNWRNRYAESVKLIACPKNVVIKKRRWL